jgi:hypothetical protein
MNELKIITLDPFVSYLKENNMIDNESISYHKEDYPFSEEDFVFAHEALRKRYFEKHSVDFSDCFEEHRMYFIYNGVRFIWRFISGQGFAYQFLIDKPRCMGWPVDWDMKFLEDKAVDLGASKTKNGLML